MNKLEYDSFYKFLVSMGVILFIAPIIAFNYLINSPYDLLVTMSELSELSPLAQQIIEIRQKLLYNAICFAPLVCIVSSIVGIVFILYGAIKWRTIQKKIDDKYDLENEQLKLNISKMSKEDISKKAEAEINEMEPETHDQNLMQMSKSYSSQRLINYLQIEKNTSKHIMKRYRETHKVHNNIRLGANEYDIVANAQKWGTQDLIFEIKYLASSTSSINVLKRSSIKLLKSKENYIKYTHRIPQAILLIVIEDSIYEKTKQCLEQYLDSNGVEDIEIEIHKESEMN